MQKKIIAAVVGLAVVGALSGCAAPSGPVVDKKPAASQTAEAEPAEVVEEEPAAEAGTRENPVPVGTAAKHSPDSVWTFTVGATDTDGWPEVSAANQFNTPPAEGSAYVLMPVHIALDATDATAAGADPWASFQVEYVTAAGNSFASTTCTAVLPEPGELYTVGTMYGGAAADFLTCSQVPVADIPGGTWKVSSMIGQSAAFFIGG